MRDNRDMERLFKSHSKEVADSGFTSEVMQKIGPTQESVWSCATPIVLLTVAIMVGFLVVVLSGVGGELIEGVVSLAYSLTVSEIPPIDAIASFGAVVATSLLVGWSILYASELD